MRAPYGLNILDNCMTCPARGKHLFCNLSVQPGQRLNGIKSTAVYPKGAMLFIEGQMPPGSIRALQRQGEAFDDIAGRQDHHYEDLGTKISDAGESWGWMR